jgi:hypothetical protein
VAPAQRALYIESFASINYFVKQSSQYTVLRFTIMVATEVGLPSPNDLIVFP